MGKFQNVLRMLRISNNLTQDELSKALKISRSTIGMYEKGAREPDFETLELIADFFNVDTDYLLGRTDKTTIIPQSASIALHNVHCETETEGNLIISFRKLNNRNKERCTIYTTSLLATQQMEMELEANAAQARTDIDVPEGTDTSDDDIMNDKDF